MYKKIFIIILIWLIIVNIFALLTLNRFNLSADTAYSWINPKEFSPNQNWNLINLHSQWDSIWYLDIAKNGYVFNGEGKLSNIVFFPLYPFLIKIISFITLGNYELAGWTVSIAGLILASLYLYKLVKQFHPHIDPIFTNSLFINLSHRILLKFNL